MEQNISASSIVSTGHFTESGVWTGEESQLSSSNGSELSMTDHKINLGEYLDESVVSMCSGSEEG